MSSAAARSSGQFHIRGLRTRFFPKSRIGHGLVSMAPWFDVLFLLFFFVLLQSTSSFILQPGITVELPRGEFTGGSHPDLIAVILYVGGVGGIPGREVAFFDDERFVLSNEGDMERFKEALAARASGKKEVDLVFEADKRIQHGTMVKLMNTAVEAGVDSVNFAQKPEHPIE
ncbi:MAG: ExbD/TolR family protein [Verrucomicrobiota bacterium]